MARQLAKFNLPGPFLADQLRPGDPYELSNGHPIECLPVGGRGSQANLIGAAVLDSDPDVDAAGVDTGFAITPAALRAPGQRARSLRYAMRRCWSLRRGGWSSGHWSARS